MPIMPWEEYARHAAGVRDATLEGGAPPAQTGIPTGTPAQPVAPPPAAPAPSQPQPQPQQPQPQPQQPPPQPQPVPPEPAVQFEGGRSNDFRPFMDEAEAQYGVPAQLLEAMAWRESKFDPTAVSEAGATGLMQIMPETAKWLGIDPNDPKQAVHGAAKYLSYLKNRFGGDWRKAVAAYHAGEGNVSKSIQKHGDKWLENGEEFELGPITRDYVEEMEPVLIALEAQPEPTDYAALDPRAANREGGIPTGQPDDTAQFMPDDVSSPYAQFNPMPDPELEPLPDPATRRQPTNTTGIGSPDMPLFGGEADLEAGAQGYRMPTGGYGKALMAGTKGVVGAATGFVDTLTGAVLDAPPLFESFRETLRESQDADIASMRPELQRGNQKKWATMTDAAWADPQAWAVQFTQQIPNLATTILPPLRVAAVVHKAALAKGLSAAAARKAAQKGAALAGGAAEGGIVTGFTREQIESEMLNAPHEDLMEALPQYRELIKEHGDTPEGQRLAKLAIAADLSESYALLAGGGAYALGHIAGKWLGRVVTGGGKGGRLANAARTGTVETGQEAGQESYEQMVTNLALGRPAMEGTLEAAAAGGALGGPAGVAVGAVSPTAPKQPKPPPDTGIPETSESTPGTPKTGPQVSKETAEAAVKATAKKPVAPPDSAKVPPAWSYKTGWADKKGEGKGKPAEDQGPDESAPKRKVGVATSKPSPSMQSFLEENEEARSEYDQLFGITTVNLRKKAAEELGEDYNPNRLKSKARMAEAIVRKRRGFDINPDTDIEGYAAKPEAKVPKRERQYDAPSDTWTGAIDRLNAGGTLQSETTLNTLKDEVGRLNEALPAKFSRMPKGSRGVRSYSTFLRNMASNASPEGKSAVRKMRKAIQRQDAEALTAAVDDLLMAEQTQSFMESETSNIAKAVIWARTKASRVVRREGKLNKRTGEEEGNTEARRTLHRGAERATVAQQLDAVADYANAMERAASRINSLAEKQFKQLEKRAKQAEQAKNKRKDKRYTEEEKALRRRYQQWKKWNDTGITFGTFKSEEFYRTLESIRRLQRQASSIKATMGQSTANRQGVSPKDAATITMVTGSTETVGYTARNVSQKWATLAKHETKLLESLRLLEEELVDTRPPATTKKQAERNSVLAEIDEALRKRPAKYIFSEEDALAADDAGVMSAYAAMVRREFTRRYQQRQELLEDLLWMQEKDLLDLEDKYWARKAGAKHIAGREAHARKKYKAEAREVYKKYAALGKEVQARYASLDEGYVEAASALEQFRAAKAEAAKLDRVAEHAQDVLEEQADDWDALTAPPKAQVAGGSPSTEQGRKWRRKRRFYGKKQTPVVRTQEQSLLEPLQTLPSRPPPPDNKPLSREERSTVSRKTKPLNMDLELGATERVPKIGVGTKLVKGEAEHPVRGSTNSWWRHRVRARGLRVLRLNPVAPRPVEGTDITGQREIDPERARDKAGFGNAAVVPMVHASSDRLARKVDSLLEDAPNISDEMSSAASESVTGGRPQQLISPIKLLRLLEANGIRASAFDRIVTAKIPQLQEKTRYAYVVTVTAPDGSFKTRFDGDNPNEAYKEIKEFLHDVRNKNLLWPPLPGSRSASDQNLRSVRRRDTAYKETLVREGTKYLDAKHKAAGLPKHTDTTYRIELVEMSQPSAQGWRTIELDLASTTEALLAQLAKLDIDALHIEGSGDFILTRKPDSSRHFTFGVPIPSDEQLAKEAFVEQLYKKLQALPRQQARQQLNRMKASELLQVMKYLRIGKANNTKPERVEWLLDHFAEKGTTPEPKKLSAAEQAELNKKVAREKAHEIFIMRAKNMPGPNHWGEQASQAIDWLTEQVEKAQRNKKPLDYYVPPAHYNELSKKAKAQLAKLRQDATNERAARALRVYLQEMKLWPRDESGNVDMADFPPWFRKKLEAQRDEARLAQNTDPLKVAEKPEELGAHRIAGDIDVWLADLGLTDLIGTTPERIDLLKQVLPEVNTKSWTQMRALRQSIADQRGVASLREYDNATHVLIAAPAGSEAWVTAYNKLNKLMANYFGEGKVAENWLERTLGYTSRLNELYEQRLEENAAARAEDIKADIEYMTSLPDEELDKVLYDLQYEEDAEAVPEGVFHELTTMLGEDAEFDAAIAALDPDTAAEEARAAATLRLEAPSGAAAVAAGREAAEQDTGTTLPLSDESLLYRKAEKTSDLVIGNVLNQLAPNTVEWLRSSLLAPEADVTVDDFMSAMLDDMRGGGGALKIGPSLQRIADLKLDVPIVLVDTAAVRGGDSSLAEYQHGFDRGGRYNPAMRRIEISNELSGDMLMRVALHEATHAATYLKYMVDPTFANEADGILDEVRSALVAKGFVTLVSNDNDQAFEYQVTEKGIKAGFSNSATYGLTNAMEMMAESTSSGQFTRLLSKVSVPKARSWFQRMLAAIKRTFGFASEETTLFDMVLDLTNAAMMSEVEQQAETGFQLDTPATVANFKAPTREQVTTQIDGWARNKQSTVKRMMVEGNLGFMDLNFMLRKHKGLFGRAKKFLNISENPLERYTRSSLRAVADVRKLSTRAHHLVERNLKLTKQARTMLAELELESTLAGIYADGTLDPAGKNSHLYRFDKESNTTVLKKASSEAAFVKLKAKYETLKGQSPEAAALYAEKYQMTRELHRRKLWETRRLVGLNAGLTHEQAAIFADSRTLTAVKAKIKAGTLTFPNADIQADALRSLKQANKLNKTVAGPYFHIYRPGDYFVYTTDNDEKRVATYRTEYEAKQAMAELQKSGRSVAVSRKIESAMLNQPMSAVISDMMRNMPDPKDTDEADEKEARRAIRRRLEHAAVIAAAADSLVESSRLKRNNVEGANPKDQLEGFVKYVNSSLHAIGDLNSLYDTKEALKDLNALTETGSQNPNISVDDALMIGNITRELKLRIKHGAAFQDVTGVERFMGNFGFMAFLGSPAYWFLNGTQTVAIGIPVLAARTRKGVAESSKALGEAMSILVKAAKGADAGLDLDKLIANLPKEYQSVARRLQDDGTITSNIAQEFGDLLNQSKASSPLVWKVLKVFEHMPQRIEHFNRLGMAIAAVKLGANEELARDVTEESQFLYDPANRARLLKYAPMWAGGGLRPLITPIMMFKVFGINATRLLYGNMIDTVKISAKLRNPNLSAAEKTELRAQRREAIKVFGGMMASHTLLGGITGGLGIGAAQIIGSTINAMLDDEDKIDWNVAIFNSLSEMSNDYAANILMHGAPAAVGARMSGSINLGNLLFSPRDRDLSQHGGVAMSALDMLGPNVSWATGAGQAVASWADNDIPASKMMEKIMPLKVAQGTARAWNMATKGMTTGTGNEILPPDVFRSAYGMTQVALTAAGFRGTVGAQTQDKFYSDIKFDRRIQEQRGKVIRQAAQATTFDEKLKANRAQQEWNQRMRQRGFKDLIVTRSTVLRSRKARDEVQGNYAAGQYSKYR